MSKASLELVHQWKERIEEWQASGKNKAQWCRENNLSCDQFYYWSNRLFAKAEKLPDHSFTELHDEEPCDPGVCIQCENLSIRLSRHFDEDTLLRCLRVMRSAS